MASTIIGLFKRPFTTRAGFRSFYKLFTSNVVVPIINVKIIIVLSDPGETTVNET